MRQKHFFNDVFFCPVQITAVRATPDEYLSGTGFILQIGSEKPVEERVSVMFCNRSLIESAKGKIALRFHLQELYGGIGEKGEIIEQTQSDMDVYGKDAPLYLAHPDDSVDLACINISHYLSGHYPSDDYGIFYHALTPEWFASDAIADLAPDLNVSLVGFPHGVHNIQNLPLFRGFRMPNLGSTMEQGDAPFKLKGALLSGCGGGPVFFATNNEHRLLGVLSAPSVVTGEDAGGGTVVPIVALKQLLSLAVERANDPNFNRKRPHYSGERHLKLDYALTVF